MPKALTDRDRILNFAFKASSEELADAISVLKAAHAAKTRGAGTPRRVVAATRTRAAKPAADKTPGDDTTVN